MLAFLFWDPPKEIFSFSIPLLGRPLVWYGCLFAVGFLLGYLLFLSLLQKYYPSKAAKRIAETLLSYCIIGVILGARIVDVLFYQDWRLVYEKPLELFTPWEGGLSSHGGVLGLIIALAIFYKRHKMLLQGQSFLRLLDLLCIPSTILATCIRMGNFINQEILGTQTSVPWAVIFGHPADGSAPIPRHPVQLYEALFYLLLGIVLFSIRSHLFRKRPGTLVGIFLTVVFIFRFCIEYWKMEQSDQMPLHAFFSMGQLLSIPFIVTGIILLAYKNAKK